MTGKTTTRIKTNPDQRRTITSSDAIRAAAASRRLVGPIALRGIGEAKLIKISPSLYGKLDVDPSYQRDEQKKEINELITAIQNGGFVPDPVTLVKRTYGPEAERSKLWIIDGQQRTAAFMRMDQTFSAMVYEAESIEAERNFFLVMNTTKDIGANTFIRSWPGPSSLMLRAVSEQEGHQLCGRVSWKSGQPGKLSAGIVVRGMMSATCGAVQGRGNMRSILSRVDNVMKSSPAAKERARVFLHLVGEVFPEYAKTLPMQALGVVAYERWTEADAVMPPAAVLRSLRVINWNSITESTSSRFRPVFEAEIRKRWKA